MENFLMMFVGVAVTLGLTYLLRRLNKRQEAILASNGPRPVRGPIDWRAVSRDFMALLVIAGFFSVLAALITRAVPPENKDVLLIMVGILASSYKDVIGYQWGSSYGSQLKDKAAADVAKEEAKDGK